MRQRERSVHTNRNVLKNISIENLLRKLFLIKEDEEEASEENSGKSQSPEPKTVMSPQNGAIKNGGNEKNGGVKQGSSFPILETLTPCDVRVLVHSEV